MSRILAVEEIHRLFAIADTDRDAALLRTLYYGGLLSAELASLRWGQVRDRNGRGELRVVGQVGRWRDVLVPVHLYARLVRIRRGAGISSAVFANPRTGLALTPRGIYGIVARTAARAGVPDVSPRALRDAHQAHALARGAPEHVVRATLGLSNSRGPVRHGRPRPNDSSALYLPAY